jgi:hypothetical protein
MLQYCTVSTFAIIVLHAYMCYSLLFQFHSSHNCVRWGRGHRVSDVRRVHDVTIHTEHAAAVYSLENRHLDDGTRKPKLTDSYSTCIKLLTYIPMLIYPSVSDCESIHQICLNDDASRLVDRGGTA